jgi:hypothetical protein
MFSGQEKSKWYRQNIDSNCTNCKKMSYNKKDLLQKEGAFYDLTDHES